MSGIARELPYEAVGPACGVFIFSTICLTGSCLLLWATLAHREWKSYVALLAFFTSLSTLASMAQQLHTYLRWTSIKLAQSDHVKANVDNPELSIAGASVGVDLVLFYIQFYTYNVESILVVSWCTQLCYSVFRLKASNSTSRYGSNIAKTAAILLPVIQVSLMRSKVLQANEIGFYIVANAIMAVSLTVGTILLLTILGRYVATRAEMTWHVQYGSRSTMVDTEAANASRADNVADLASLAETIEATAPLYRKSIYDNWLLVRFTIAFAGLAAFQLVVILQEIAFSTENDRVNADETVDLEPSHAVADVESFLPGVSASMLAFIVFGTTKAFRDFFYVRMVPRCIRRKIHARRSNRIPSVVNPNNAGALPGSQPRNRRSPSEIMQASMPMSPNDITGPLSSRSECFELEGGEVGLYPETGMVYELATPTPTHSTFELRKKTDEDDDRWPILNIPRHR